jgi:hypothetical protein
MIKYVNLMMQTNHHRYIFKAEDNEDKEEQKKDLAVNLQEIGPRFVFQL